MKAMIKYDDEQDSKKGRDIDIIYVNNDRAFAQTYINSNAFPSDLIKIVNTCISRFALLHNQIKLIDKQIVIDIEMFKKHIEDPRFKLKEVLLKNNLDEYEAKYDSLEILNFLTFILYSLKSFLDSYSFLMVKLIDRNVNISFSKKNIDNKKLSGGALIQWLINSAPKEFTQKEKLAKFIKKESEEWITNAVIYRDKMTHNIELNDINYYKVKLNRITENCEPIYNENKIKIPVMPNGMNIKDYSLYIGKRTREFYINTISMYDNINFSLLKFSNFNVKEPIWSK